MGYPLMEIGAEPYIGVAAIFSQVIQPYLLSGAMTSSATVVPTPSPLPSPVALTLTSATGFNAGDSVTVDVDARSETVTVQSISGSVATFLLAKPHTGTYPVVNSTTSTTTSTSTVVPAIVTPPSLVTLTLTDPTGFHANDTIIVDDGARQEATRVLSISGSTITAYLTKGHSGTYPVTVEGGESILRGVLQILQSLNPMGGNAAGLTGSIGGAIDGAGIKKVDEIEFFGPSSFGGSGASFAGTPLQQILAMIEYYRDMLEYITGIPRLNGHCGSGLSVY